MGLLPSAAAVHDATALLPAHHTRAITGAPGGVLAACDAKAAAALGALLPHAFVLTAVTAYVVDGATPARLPLPDPPANAADSVAPPAPAPPVGAADTVVVATTAPAAALHATTSESAACAVNVIAGGAGHGGATHTTAPAMPALTVSVPPTAFTAQDSDVVPSGYATVNVSGVGAPPGGSTGPPPAGGEHDVPTRV